MLVVSTSQEYVMLRMALCVFAFSANFAFAGDKGQAPAASKTQAPAAPAKSQAAPTKIVTQTVITREYVPVEKHRRLFFRQIGASKVETCTNCVNCPNCQK